MIGKGVANQTGTFTGYGTNHELRKQRGWVGGGGKMLTFAYMVGGWVKANAYVSKILEITRRK